MRSFQKFSVKFVFFRVLRQQFGYFLGFSKTFPTSIPITSALRVPPPGILAFTAGKSLRRKDNNYLAKFDTC